MDITTSEVDQIVAKMRSNGFETRAVGNGWLAFTCPPCSRPMFGMAIYLALIPRHPEHVIEDVLRAAKTEHNRETREVTLYFPGVWIEGT